MRDATLCTHHPVVSEEGYASLSVPTHRASTIVFPNASSYANRGNRDLDGYSYGLHGTPTNRVLEAQLSALEGGTSTVLLPSGQSAIAVVFLTVLGPGDHVLVPDTAYPPVIGLCENFLEPRGIKWGVYPPGIGAGIENFIKPETRLIWTESPGSTTMEVEDIPAIARIAQERGIKVGADNTWATPVLFKPLAHGIDFSMQALTKYVGGHSDLLLGSVSVANPDLRGQLRDTMRMLGLGVAPDTVRDALRGLETLAVRIHHMGYVATEFAKRLSTLNVGDVLYPALPGSLGHEVWKRDFSGASGLFSVVLPEGADAQLDSALDRLKFFAIGASWGGTRSLVAPMSTADKRRFPHPWNTRTILRVSVGLEDPQDLWADLQTFFESFQMGDEVMRTKTT